MPLRRPASRAMPVPAGELRPPRHRRAKPDQPRRHHHERERQVEQKQRHKRRHRHPIPRPIGQRAPTHPDQGLHHNRQHRRLEPEKKPLDRCQATEQHINPRQRHDRQQTGQHKQPARHQTAGRAMHEPADIGRQLLRLRPRQQRAIGQRMQEPLLADPSLFLHDDPVHHRNLPRRTAKRQQRHARPNPGGLPECHAMVRKMLRRCGHATSTLEPDDVWQDRQKV